MGAWIVRGGVDGVWEEYDLANDVVLIGWYEVGDVSDVADVDELDRLLEEGYPESSVSKRRASRTQLWQFLREMETGDVVVLPFKGSDNVAIGELVGPYRYIPDGPDRARHGRDVRWIENDVARVRFADDLRRVFDVPATVSPMRAKRAEARLRTVAQHRLPDGYEEGGALDGFADPVAFVTDNFREVPRGPGVHVVWNDAGELLYAGYTNRDQVERLREHLGGDRQASILHKRIGEVLDEERDHEANRDEIRDYLNSCTVAWLATDAAEVRKQRIVEELTPRFVGRRGSAGEGHQVWLFQAQPSRFDIDSYLEGSAPGDVGEWTVTRYADQMSDGDRMVIFRAGRPGGLCALTKLLGEVFEDPSDDEFGPRKIEFVFIDIVDDPVPRQELKDHPVLSELGPLKFSQQTNYKVSDEQWEAIKDLTGWTDEMDAEPSTWLNGPYFIFTASSTDDIGDTEHDDIIGKQYAFHENVAGKQQLLDAGHGQFIYYHTGQVSGETGQTFAGTGWIEDVLETAPVDGKKHYRAALSGYRSFERPVPREVFSPRRWNPQHSISSIGRRDFEEILRRGGIRIARGDLEVDKVRAVADDMGLIVREEVIAAAVAALMSGKHIMLTGPPGTGKTTLAHAIATAAFEAGLCDEPLLTTATADWTTFDTIGGYRPTSENTLRFHRGQFLAAIEADSWLVVDELNRSNFDRAFGQLFTVLSGQPVELPFDDPASGGRIRIVPHEARFETEQRPGDIEVSNDWRLIGTMNVFDKSLLFEMSYALMRRFAFIEVGPPDDATYRELIRNKISEINPDDVERARTVVGSFMGLRAIKELGPALFLDMARFAAERLRLSAISDHELAFQLFYSYLLPQFEGIDESDGRRLLRELRPILGSENVERTRVTLNSVLGLELLAQRPAPHQDEETS